MSIDRPLIGRVARRAAMGVGILLMVGWLVILRPQAFGGPAAYITVAGVSMEPTLHAGDLVILTKADAYEPGDVVAFRVPEGDPAAGRHVIHRIIGGGAGDGYLLQGDNTPAPDRWRPTHQDIVGRQLAVLPGFGSLLMLLKTPALIAGLAAALIVFSLPQWSVTGGGRVSGSQRKPSALERLARSPAAGTEVITLNQAILVNEHSTAVAQILVELRNLGSQWAEVSAATSTYVVTGKDGSTMAEGSFTSVEPRWLGPGETGYMLGDIREAAVGSKRPAAVSSLIACRVSPGGRLSVA